jgi:hypothetical protein
MLKYDRSVMIPLVRDLRRRVGDRKNEEAAEVAQELLYILGRH